MCTLCIRSLTSERSYIHKEPTLRQLLSYYESLTVSWCWVEEDLTLRLLTETFITVDPPPTKKSLLSSSYHANFWQFSHFKQSIYCFAVADNCLHLMRMHTHAQSSASIIRELSMWYQLGQMPCASFIIEKIITKHLALGSSTTQSGCTTDSSSCSSACHSQYLFP